MCFSIKGELIVFGVRYMKKLVYFVLMLGFLCSYAYGYGYDTQRVPGKPKRETWFVYLDYTLNVFEDVYVSSWDVEDSTFADPKAPFQVDNDSDLLWKSNNFLLGASHIFIDNGDEGVMSWYAGAGSVNISLDLFQEATIGTKGWMIEGGIKGDIVKFGQLLDSGIAFDASVSAILADGSSGGTVDEEYEMTGFRIDGSVYYTRDIDLFDTTSSFAYIGGQAVLTQVSLTEEISAVSGSGTGDYTIENQSVNQIFLVLGSQLFWESNGTTADIRLMGSVDGSYSIGLTLLQNF